MADTTGLTNEATVSDPAVSEATVSKATVSDPVVPEAAVSEPAVLDSAVSGPGVSGPGVSDSAVSEPDVSQPAVSVAAVLEAAHSSAAEPDHTEPRDRGRARNRFAHTEPTQGEAASAEATEPTRMTLDRAVIEGDRTYHITATALPDGRTAISIRSGPADATELNELSGIIAREDLAMIARAFKPELDGIAAWHGITLDERAARLGQVRQRHPNAFAPWTPQQEETLLELHRAGTPRREIATRLGRPIGGIHRRLEKLGILT